MMGAHVTGDALVDDAALLISLGAAAEQAAAHQAALASTTKPEPPALSALTDVKQWRSFQPVARQSSSVNSPALGTVPPSQQHHSPTQSSIAAPSLQSIASDSQPSASSTALLSRLPASSPLHLPAVTTLPYNPQRLQAFQPQHIQSNQPLHSNAHRMIFGHSISSFNGIPSMLAVNPPATNFVQQQQHQQQSHAHRLYTTAAAVSQAAHMSSPHQQQPQRAPSLVPPMSTPSDRKRPMMSRGLSSERLSPVSDASSTTNTDVSESTDMSPPKAIKTASASTPTAASRPGTTSHMQSNGQVVYAAALQDKDDDTDDERRKKRLARKAELARLSRLRKKNKLNDLENNSESLRKQVEDQMELIDQLKVDLAAAQQRNSESNDAKGATVAKQATDESRQEQDKSSSSDAIATVATADALHDIAKITVPNNNDQLLSSALKQHVQAHINASTAAHHALHFLHRLLVQPTAAAQLFDMVRFHSITGPAMTLMQNTTKIGLTASQCQQLHVAVQNNKATVAASTIAARIAQQLELLSEDIQQLLQYNNDCLNATSNIMTEGQLVQMLAMVEHTVALVQTMPNNRAAADIQPPASVATPARSAVPTQAYPIAKATVLSS